MTQQNISLQLGSRGYTLSISQGLVGGGSLKGHHVEVALLDGMGQFVNSGHWWVDATYAQIDEDYYADVVSHIDAENLLIVIAKAKAWVNKNQ